jgi:hypothetical protein
MEDLADPVMVELVTSTQHKVSLKKVVEWMAHSGGTSPKDRDEGAARDGHLPAALYYIDPAR